MNDISARGEPQRFARCPPPGFQPVLSALAPQQYIVVHMMKKAAASAGPTATAPLIAAFQTAFCTVPHRTEPRPKVPSLIPTESHTYKKTATARVLTEDSSTGGKRGPLTYRPGNIPPSAAAPVKQQKSGETSAGTATGVLQLPSQRHASTPDTRWRVLSTPCTQAAT